jgi:putative phosphoribosyl transferase
MVEQTEVRIEVSKNIILQGNLNIPDTPIGLIIFSHGSGSNRFSVRNVFVAQVLNKAGFATLLTDLLTVSEDAVYENRFNIDLLTERLITVIERTSKLPEFQNVPIGCFGASTGAASALKAAARLPHLIKAVVSRGGRPDLASSELSKVKCPTLLIVGSLDSDVITLNEQAFSLMECKKQMEIVEGATHLFEEQGTLEKVSHLASSWFKSHIPQKEFQKK